MRRGLIERRGRFHGFMCTAVCAAVVAVLGCSQDHAILLAEGESSLRLVDFLPEAEVSSPLVQVQPIESIDQIPDIEPSRTVPGRFMVGQSTGCRTESGADGGFEVFCNQQNVEAWWELPVAAYGHIRIGLDVRANPPGCFEVAVQN